LSKIDVPQLGNPMNDGPDVKQMRVYHITSGAGGMGVQLNLTQHPELAKRIVDAAKRAADVCFHCF
jgi:hypothetical protein